MEAVDLRSWAKVWLVPSPAWTDQTDRKGRENCSASLSTIAMHSTEVRYAGQARQAVGAVWVTLEDEIVAKTAVCCAAVANKPTDDRGLVSTCWPTASVLAMLIEQRNWVARQPNATSTDHCWPKEMRGSGEEWSRWWKMWATMLKGRNGFEWLTSFLNNSDRFQSIWMR